MPLFVHGEAKDDRRDLNSGLVEIRESNEGNENSEDSDASLESSDEDSSGEEVENPVLRKPGLPPIPTYLSSKNLGTKTASYTSHSPGNSANIENRRKTLNITPFSLDDGPSTPTFPSPVKAINPNSVRD